MRKPADFAGRPSGSFTVTFRSLLAILLPGFALRQWPEVRRGLARTSLKSTGYARTVQAVVFRLCQGSGTGLIQRVESERIAHQRKGSFAQEQAFMLLRTLLIDLQGQACNGCRGVCSHPTWLMLLSAVLMRWVRGQLQVTLQAVRLQEQEPAVKSF